MSFQRNGLRWTKQVPPAIWDPVSSGQQWRVLMAALIALDALAIAASLALAYTLRISSGLLIYQAESDLSAYSALALVSVPIWLVLFSFVGLYQRDNLLGGVIEYQQIFKACTGGVLALIVLSFMWRDLVLVSRGWLMLAWMLSFVLVMAERFLIRRVAYQLRRQGWFTARVLIVGANDQGIAIARQWERSARSGMRVVGFVDDFKPLGTPVCNGLKVIGRPTALADLVHQVAADEVVVVPNAVAWETFEEVIARASAPNGYTLRLSPGFYEMLTTGVAVTNKAFVPLFTVNEERLVGSEAAFKMLLDYGVGVPMLIASAPLMGLIALALKLLWPDEPVLRHHQTLGQRGAIFQMSKFRPVASSFAPSSRWGRTSFGRLTIVWLERLLFSFGLDKLPQLFNVIAGQMSLVGPRPRVLGEEMDAQMVRNLQTVKPGFIGPWTLAREWSNPDERQDELYYVRNWTIWLDIQILFQTAGFMITAGRLARRAVNTRAIIARPTVPAPITRSRVRTPFAPPVKLQK